MGRDVGGSVPVAEAIAGLLEAMLRRRGIRTLAITGVATDICIDSTLRDAFLRDCYVAVPAECVGSANRALHEATLQNLGFLFGDLTGDEEVARIWGAAPPYAGAV